MAWMDAGLERCVESGGVLASLTAPVSKRNPPGDANFPENEGRGPSRRGGQGVRRKQSTTPVLLSDGPKSHVWVSRGSRREAVTGPTAFPPRHLLVIEPSRAAWDRGQFGSDHLLESLREDALQSRVGGPRTERQGSCIRRPMLAQPGGDSTAVVGFHHALPAAALADTRFL